MDRTQVPEVHQLTLADAEDITLVRRVADLINDAYRTSEDGIWIDTAARTTAAEIVTLIGADELAVARLGGEIVGCVRVQSIDKETSEFGMLSTDRAFRGIGIGRELVTYAERFSCAGGHRRMQLKLLWPRDRVHPFKQFLADWYLRLGYSVSSKGSMEVEFPSLARLLVAPCYFMTYHKDLTAPAPAPSAGSICST
jgi:GNAT superfamily N-acetyltransferase